MITQHDIHETVRPQSHETFNPGAVATADLLNQFRQASARLLPTLAQAATHLVTLEAWKYFGFANVHDFSREKLDHSGRWLRNLASTGTAIQQIPALAHAVTGNEGHEPLGRSAAFEISRVATTQTAARWIALARQSTVRQLKQLVHSHLSDAATIENDTERPCDSSHRRQASLFIPTPTYVAAAFEKLERVFLASNPGCARAEFLDALIAEYASTCPTVLDAQTGPGHTVAQTQSPQVEHLRERALQPLPAVPVPVAPLPQETHRQPSIFGGRLSEKQLGRLHIQALWSLQRAKQFESRAPSCGNQPRIEESLHTLLETLEIERDLSKHISLLLHWLEARDFWTLLGFDNGAHFSESVLQESASTYRNRLRFARALETSTSLYAAFESGDLSAQRVLRIARLANKLKLRVDAVGEWAEHASSITIKRLDDEIRFVCHAGSRNRRPLPPTDEEWFTSLRFGPGEARHHLLAGTLEALTLRPVANVFLKLWASSDTIDALRLCLRTVRRRLIAQSQHLAELSPAAETRLFPSIRLAGQFLNRSNSLPDWLCLLAILEEFAEEWDNPKHIVHRPTDAITIRDGWRCTAPGCSARSLEVHHIVYQSRGGSDEPSNLTTLCPFHHRMGEHGTLASVVGKAPLALRWLLGSGRQATLYVNERATIRRTALNP